MTTMTAVSAQDKILAVSSSLSEPTAVSSEDTPEKAAATAAKEIAESRSNPLSKDDDDDDDDDESAEEEQDQLKEESPHGDDESGEEADGDLEEDVSSSDEDSSSSSSDEDDDDEEEEERDGKNKNNNNNNNNNELSEYELLRLQRIERNRARLEQLGLLEDNIPKKKQDNKRRRSSVSQPPLEPLRQLPKREARNKVVFQQTLDMRTFRVSSKQSPNTQVQKRCGECIGCTRQADCNTCVYCAERLRGRRTRFYRCLFKACRKRLIPNQDTKMEEKKDDSSSAPATQPPTPTPTPAHCEMCKQPNNQDLVCCTRCNLGYHSNCHVPKIHRLPLAGDQWLCKPCKQTISKNDKHKLKLASKNELVAVFPSENKQKRNTIKVKVLKPTTTCGLCHQASSDHKIMIQCKACDDHFHLFCQDPPLESKPVGRDFRTWRCNQCQANDKPLLEHHQKARPPSIRRTQMSLELFQGEHNDQCFMCFNGGQLVCCDFCPKVYHCQCHIPALPALPSNDNYWKCCECYASERTRMTRCGECKACLSTDCGKCQFCKDKPKFGGPGSLKKGCVQRDCPYLSLAETYIPGKIPGEICGPVRSNNTFKKKRAREEEETTTTTTKDDDPQDDDDDASEHMTYPQQDNNYNYNKRGKRKKPKDKPKRPLSAYNFFFKEERGRILEGLGDAKPHDKLGFESLAKVIGKRWQDLSTEDMAEYQKKAEASTVQYRKALTEWQANQTTSSLDTTPRNTITPQKTNRQKHNTPKRPQSAFLAYANSRRGKVKAQNPHVNNSELSQMLSVMWKNAPDNIKQEYRGDEAAGWAAYKKEAVESVTNISLPNHPNDQVDDDEKAPAKNKPKPIELQHDEPILVFLKIPKLKDSISVKIRKIINNASRNPLDSKIQDKACEHLRKFTDSKDYIQKIVLSGGIEMIADAMEQHPDKTIVQAEAYATLAEMVFLCPEIAAKLIHMGILDLILACMGNKKNNDKVQQMGCGVFRALSHSTDNMDIIMKSGGVSAVLSSMKENPKRLLVQREGCFFLQNMLAPNEVGHRVEDVAKDILDAKLLPIVLDALSSEVVDSTVKEGVCGLVANLALVPTAKRSIVKTSNAIPALLATMRGNREVSVREPACAALMYIAFGSAENRGKITKAGGLAAIMASIQTFPKDPVMLISAFGLMKELALKDEEVASDFVNQGGSAFVLSGMAEHSHLAMMQVAACGVISYLPFTKRDKIAPKLAKAIVSALENHPDVVNVQAACCEALLEIATNVPAVRKLVKDKKSRKLLLEAKEKFRDCESDVMDLLAF